MEVFSMLSVVSHAYGCSSHGSLWLGESAGLLSRGGRGQQLTFPLWHPLGKTLDSISNLLY